MKKAAMIIADGFEEMEAIVPWDLLKRAGVDVTLVSQSGKRTAVGAHEGTLGELTAPEAYSFEEADAIILPGGTGGYEKLRADENMKKHVRSFAEEGKIVAAICACGALLGQMGLLVGKNYTCYPTMDGDFGGAYKREPAVTDGNIITGIGPGGAFSFGLALVEKLAGKDVKDEVSEAACWLF